MWNRLIQFPLVSGRTQNEVVKFGLALQQVVRQVDRVGVGAALAGRAPCRRSPFGHQPVVPVRVAAPDGAVGAGVGGRRARCPPRTRSGPGRRRRPASVAHDDEVVEHEARTRAARREAERLLARRGGEGPDVGAEGVLRGQVGACGQRRRSGRRPTGSPCPGRCRPSGCRGRSAPRGGTPGRRRGPVSVRVRLPVVPTREVVAGEAEAAHAGCRAADQLDLAARPPTATSGRCRAPRRSWSAALLPTASRRAGAGTRTGRRPWGPASPSSPAGRSARCWPPTACRRRSKTNTM